MFQRLQENHLINFEVICIDVFGKLSLAKNHPDLKMQLKLSNECIFLIGSCILCIDFYLALNSVSNCVIGWMSAFDFKNVLPWYSFFLSLKRFAVVIRKVCQLGGPIVARLTRSSRDRPIITSPDRSSRVRGMIARSPQSASVDLTACTEYPCVHNTIYWSIQIF